MATWEADVFVNSRVGQIKTQVEAATFIGAREQIYAKHGDVKQITNLREVGNNWFSSSSSSDGDSLGSLIAILAIIAIAFAINYWYISLPILVAYLVYRWKS